MRKNIVKSIDVFFDARNSDYYVRFIFSSNEEMPGFEEMSSEQKQTLYTEFPELQELGKKPSAEMVEEYIDPKIKEYNERCRSSLRTKWKVYDGKVLMQINQNSRLQKIEKQFETFIYFKYDGSADDFAIISFIEECKTYHKTQYMTYYCDKCKQWKYGKIANKKVICKCGSVFSIENEGIFVFSGDDALTLAAEKAIEKNTSTHTEQPIEFKTRSFYYKGTSYGLNLREFKVIHEVLYHDCAINSIFIKDNSGKIAFQPAYENYLRGMSEKKIDSRVTELYNSKVRILSEINSAANDIYGMMLGFYWYFMEFKLTESTALYWDTTDFKFDSPEEYAIKLCVAPESTKVTLLSLFNEQTCRYFFIGYDSRRIELSRLIYEKAGGRYVYIDEENNIIDFGTNFIQKLSVYDDKIVEKNQFILAIHSDEAFWEHIKGSYDLEDGYWSDSGETYYDLLCYYQFAIQGKRVLNYLDLQIKNSKEGMDYIRAVVSNAYLRNDDATLKKYSDLLNLIFKTYLLDKLVFRYEGYIRVGQSENEPFIDTLMNILNPTETIPSIQAYFFCLNSVDGKVRFKYDGRIDTLIGHAKHLNSNVIKDNYSLINYILSDEVRELLQYIFAERYDSIISEAQDAFEKLKEEINNFSKGLDKRIHDMMYSQATGQSDVD